MKFVEHYLTRTWAKISALSEEKERQHFSIKVKNFLIYLISAFFCINGNENFEISSAVVAPKRRDPSEDIINKSNQTFVVKVDQRSQ